MGSSFHSTTSDSGTSCARFEQDGHSKGPSIPVRHSLFFLNDFLYLKAQFVPSLKMSSKAHGKYIWKYPSKAFRYDSLVPCRWPSNKTNTTLTTDCNHRITYCSVLLTTVYSNAEWPQSIISFYIILVFFSITFKEMLKHPGPQSSVCLGVYPVQALLYCSFVQCTPLVYTTDEPWRAMKSWIVLSISSSVMVLKTDKCSRSNKRNRRIISHVKPGLCKSFSTSGGISTDGLYIWACILYCLTRDICYSRLPWYIVSKVLEEILK